LKLALALLLAGSAGAADAPALPQQPAKKPATSGYGAKIDAVAVIGPPPAPGSAADAADRAAVATTAAGIGGPVWAQGKAQLSLRSRGSMRGLACALGRSVSAQATPATSRLLARAHADVSGPAAKAKTHFRRDRPFVGDANQQTCDPRTRDAVKPGSGDVLGFSYPSGHAAYGRMAARVLAQAKPGRRAALQQWGDGMGDNRVACRLHWPSDVAAGRKLADAAFARIKADPAFLADVAAARAELENAPLAIGC
jgi:acid phosphatase (class A)